MWVYTTAGHLELFPDKPSGRLQPVKISLFPRHLRPRQKLNPIIEQDIIPVFVSADYPIQQDSGVGTTGAPGAGAPLLPVPQNFVLFVGSASASHYEHVVTKITSPATHCWLP